MKAKKLVKVLGYVFKLLKQDGQANKSYLNIVLYLIMILSFRIVIVMRSGFGCNVEKTFTNVNKYQSGGSSCKISVTLFSSVIVIYLTDRQRAEKCC